jgi:hypothetical protein
LISTDDSCPWHQEEKHSLELEGTMSTVKNVRMYR